MAEAVEERSPDEDAADVAAPEAVDAGAADPDTTGGTGVEVLDQEVREEDDAEDVGEGEAAVPPSTGPPVGSSLANERPSKFAGDQDDEDKANDENHR